MSSGAHVDVRFDTMVVAETRDAALAGRGVTDLASERGVDPFDVMCDVALADDLTTRFVVTFANDDPDAVRALLVEEGCVLGLSDAGAHAGQMCDAAMPTEFLSAWVRDREIMPLEAGIRRLTGDLADLIGLPGRGYLAPGFFGDLVVLDWDRLDPGPVRRVQDLPGNGDRLITDRPEGVVHVVVNGEPIRRDERQLPLDRLPGGLLTATVPGGHR
jgi:N-acyl-D-aspartate/D-glutamate deacylase